MLKCPDPGCVNSQSEDDNNFRGVQHFEDTERNIPSGPERLFCYKCGAEARREVLEADAILPAPPSRPLKQGDATNLPPFDVTDGDKKED